MDASVRQFYGATFGDPSARMFWDGGRLCCGVVGARASLTGLLWEEGVIEGLAALGLLADTELVAGGEGAAGYDADYQLVLRLRRPRRVSYCYEWCSEMWKAAALHLIDLLGALAPLGLTLSNPQPYYLLFDGPRPAYVNPGSIAHLTPPAFRSAVETLSASFLRPLVLSRDGKTGLARRLLRGVSQGVAAGGFAELESLEEKVGAWAETLTPADCLLKLRGEVEGLRPADAESYWTDYYGDDDSPTPAEGWSRKQREVHRVLTELGPRSVLDMACNVGRFARIAAAAGAEVVAVDFDETCVNRLYRRVGGEGPAVLPLVMDANDPTPAFGVGGGWFAPACERLRSDLALALAVSHHLVFSGMRLTFGELVRAFAPFAGRWLLVEFVPFDSPGMIYSPSDRAGASEWYNLDSFVAAFAAEFAGVTVLPGEAGARRLVLCER